ncbi:MAG: histidine kinase dimerization/phospho-acceptor domain-containing protein [Acidobacteriota bacterium]|nr:histidine kinase dimerization/phospho-acceptor domain-containing protein [Acidobacteriota bacterium]
MSRAPRWAALATALVGAADAEECLGRWALEVRPPADLVALLDPRTLAPLRALRREDRKWVPVALPPAGLEALPPRTEELLLASGRSSPLADLLYSLSLTRAMIVPLGEPVGALVLARAGAAFSPAEVSAAEQEAAWLAAALEHHRGGRAERDDAGTARELSALFEMNRSLARALGPRDVMDSAWRCLVELVTPVCGAIRLEAAGREPETGCWPAGELGRRARARLDGSSASDPSLHWLSLLPEEGAAGLVLGWHGSPPPSARRIAGAVQASLVLAAGRLEAQRRLEEDRLLRTMEGLPLGVALLTGEGRLRLVNPAARRLLESFDAWPGAGGVLERLGSVELLPQVRAALEGRSSSAEAFFPEGRRVVEMRLVPAAARAATGEVVLVLDEVTEQRRQRQQLAQAEKLSAMGELIAGVVHEINNPLSTILGYAEMLVADSDAPTRQQWIATILEEGRRCQRIVGNMLSLARSHESEGELVASAPSPKRPCPWWPIPTGGPGSRRPCGSTRRRPPCGSAPTACCSC